MGKITGRQRLPVGPSGPLPAVEIRGGSGRKEACPWKPAVRQRGRREGTPSRAHPVLCASGGVGVNEFWRTRWKDVCHCGSPRARPGRAGAGYQAAGPGRGEAAVVEKGAYPPKSLELKMPIGLLCQLRRNYQLDHVSPPRALLQRRTAQSGHVRQRSGGTLSTGLFRERHLR